MPKRKFSEHASGQTTSADESFQHVLDRGQKQLYRALRTASGFESQKLNRRQSGVATGGEQKSRFTAEADILKGLKLDEVAELYLRRTLARTTSIAAAPGFPDSLREWEKKPSPFKDTAASNVTARLYKYPPVRAAMEEILKHARRLLGVTLAANSKADPKGKLENSSGPEATEERPRKAAEGKTHSELDKNGISPVYSTISRQTRRASSMESDDSLSRFDRYMDRIAPSENAGSDHLELNSHSDSERREPFDDDSDEFAPGETDIALSKEISVHTARRSLSPAEPRPKSSKKRPKPSAPPTATTFLPSLTMGGYISGSDSVAGSSDEEAANLQLRKNRRGQRARRAIWEKKFGSKANHVRKEKEGRDHGWDARRGATAEKSRREKTKKIPDGDKAEVLVMNGPGGAHGAQAKASTPSKAKNKEDGPLHPSWEAAKKAKELKQKTAFTGKKIVFD